MKVMMEVMVEKVETGTVEMEEEIITRIFMLKKCSRNC